MSGSLFALLLFLLGGRGGRLGGVLGLLLFLQNAVGDLADERLGQLVTELDVAGHGVLRDVLGAVAHQRLTGRVVRGDAGGELDDDAKDTFFQAIMEVYLESKEEARVKFSPKKRVSKKRQKKS